MSVVHSVRLREYVERAVDIALAKQVDAGTAFDLVATCLNELAEYAAKNERAQAAQVAAVRKQAARALSRQITARCGVGARSCVITAGRRVSL